MLPFFSSKEVSYSLQGMACLNMLRLTEFLLESNEFITSINLKVAVIKVILPTVSFSIMASVHQIP